MDTDWALTDTPSPDTPRWFKGCAIAVLVLLGLTGLGAWGLAEFEKGLDGYGQLDQSGPAGSVADPLGPGATARYEDGLKVTVSRPRPEPDGTYGLTVTYDNGTDETIHPIGESPDAGVSAYSSAPLVVRAGWALDDYSSETTLNWLNSREAAAGLVSPLSPDRKRTVPVRIRPNGEGITVTVEVTPPTASFRETAYFQLTLD
ncbi:hypothetical protein [Streptomyces tirandamycinicus]|uniref:Uncharacterized protein n=1 Tax=Streptomyces tirandamycinicus TaxID=2174846 RepID=A0A2S1SXX2_9ACTN|nr:hypothetical protein [Streptomyces tirandamycinicus]AWI31238.1 hypothetical protein DDW44_22470 [Streptomyces tirandamycinicus]